MAATAARYTAEKRVVALATLTRGGGSVWCGKQSNDVRPLTEVRRGEQMCAARVLGIAPVFPLDYPDGSLTTIVTSSSVRSRIRAGVDRLRRRELERLSSVSMPRDRVVEDLLRIIREIRPQVIVTFGPDGLMGGHHDHRATHRLVRLAWLVAQRDVPHPGKLYYLTATPSTIRADRLPRPAPITTHVFVRDYQDRKRQAFECYASQGHERGRLERFIKGQGDWEVFSLAEGPAAPPDNAGLEADLFG